MLGYSHDLNRCANGGNHPPLRAPVVRHRSLVKRDEPLIDQFLAGAQWRRSNRNRCRQDKALVKRHLRLIQLNAHDFDLSL